MQEAKILLFGDTVGIPLLIKYIPCNNISGIIAASIRPKYHKELKKIAKSLKVPFIIQPKYSSSDYINFVKQIELIGPDLIWSNSYSMVIRDDVLSLAKKSLNIHGGLLPEFRGSNPTQWAIMSKAKKTGVTMHEMSSKIDEGKIVKRVEIPLDFYDSWTEINEKILRKTELMIEKFIPNAISLRWNSKDQDITNARYFKRRKPDDGKFTWSSQCVDIYNLIRAVKNPHPGAFFIDNSNNKNYLKNYLHPLKVMDLKIKNLNLEKSIKLPFQLKSKFTLSQTLILRLSEKKTKEKIDFELKNMNWDKKNIHVRLKKLFNAKEPDILPEMILYICELLNKEYEIVSFMFSKKIKDQTKDYFSKSNKIGWSDKKNSLEIS